jgi:hypothetical protein
VWRRTLDLLMERKKVQKLTRSELENAGLDRFEGTLLKVVTSQAMLDRMKARPDFQHAVNEALSDVLGSPHSVRFQLADGPRSTPAADASSGMVAAALDLGGEIVE